jgi:hypothetical protein
MMNGMEHGSLVRTRALSQGLVAILDGVINAAITFAP